MDIPLRPLLTAMRTPRPFAFAASVIALAAAIWIGAQFAIRSIQITWAEHRLEELAFDLVRRAELSVDNVIIAQVALLSGGHTECRPETIAAFQRSVYDHGALKDIKLSTPGDSCRAFGEIGLDDEIIASGVATAQQARNSDFRMMALVGGNTDGLGVSWSFRPDHALTALIRTDALIFDMLPAAIRDHASVTLSLENGDAFASYAAGDAPGPETRVFDARSHRFPIAARLSLPGGTVADWTDDPSMILHVILAGGALLAGALLARGIFPVPSEGEVFAAALRTGEILPHFQPIVSLETGRMIGCEVLARWIRPDGERIGPNIFVPLAELTGQTRDLTHAMMRQTGAALAPELTAQADFKLCFNITASQLEAPGFVREFRDVAASCGLAPEQIVLELTEREPVDLIATVKSVVKDLQALGFRVAIDDIGTGQNGLALLRGLGADHVKIDKLFIDHIDQDHLSRQIAEMLVRVAREAGMTVVAEGIERPEQGRALLGIGVGEAQGFHFARPMPAEALRAILGRADPAHLPLADQDAATHRRVTGPRAA